eukprot:5423379-Prymnesium_polylepis.1
MPHHSYRITSSASLNAENHVILKNHDVLAYLPKIFREGSPCIYQKVHRESSCGSSMLASTQ